MILTVSQQHHRTPAGMGAAGCHQCTDGHRQSPKDFTTGSAEQARAAGNWSQFIKTAKYINASVGAHLSDGTLSHPACEIRDTRAIGFGAGPAGDANSLGGDRCCVPAPVRPWDWAGLGYAERLPVSHLQLPTAGWWVVQSHKSGFFLHPDCKRS